MALCNPVNKMSDLLSVISASEKRRNLLILLNSGPKKWDAIKNTLSVTSTGMLPQVKILEEERLIARDGKNFSLTPMGRVLTSKMIPLIKTMDVFDREKKYWHEHSLDALPHELLLDISDLGNYWVIENSDEEIFDITTFLNNIAKSKTLKGISHAVHPRYPEFFLNLAKTGVEMSLILTPGVFKIMRDKYYDAFEKGLKYKSSSVYVSEENIKFSYTVTDSYFSISLFYNNGVFDSKNDLVSRDPSALAWGERIFSYYRNRSEKIETLD